MGCIVTETQDAYAALAQYVKAFAHAECLRDLLRFAESTLPPEEEGGCVRWGGTVVKGVGLFTFGKTRERVQRVAYRWHHGEPAPVVRTSCGDDLCVQPRHLQAFTRREVLIESLLAGGTDSPAQAEA